MLFRKRVNSIDLEKGKTLYYQYYGNKFEMWHDLGNEYADCRVPENTEIEWKREILKKLENEIMTAKGSDMQVAVDRYMNLLPADSEYLLLLLQTKEIDTFTAIIFCEELKNRIRNTKDKGKSAYIRYFLDEFKVKLLNKPITIHESYTNDEVMRNYDFSENNIKARINAI